MKTTLVFTAISLVVLSIPTVQADTTEQMRNILANSMNEPSPNIVLGVGSNAPDFTTVDFVCKAACKEFIKKTHFPVTPPTEPPCQSGDDNPLCYIVCVVMPIIGGTANGPVFFPEGELGVGIAPVPSYDRRPTTSWGPAIGFYVC